MGIKDSSLYRTIFKGSVQAIDDRASKGIVDDTYFSYFNGSPNGNPAPAGLNILLDLYEKDPIVNTAINVRTNAILQSGYSLEGSKTAITQGEAVLKKVEFNYTFLDKLVKNGLLYDHVFIELVKDGSKVNELHILDPSEMEILHDQHGVIEGYQQRAVTGAVVKWAPEEIVYIPFSQVTNKVWGSVNLKTLFKTATTKNLIENFISSLAVTNAWRQVFKTKTMSKEAIGELTSYMREAQKDPTFPFIFKQPATADKDDNSFELLRDPADLKEFLGTLDYLRAQMLMQLRTPPMLVGLTDNSNRSNGDSQFKSFNMDNEAFRTLIEEFFNNYLFKALGITSEFKWNPLDKRSTKDDVEIAEKLMNMGAKPKQVEAFLRKAGVELPEGEFFDKKEEPVMVAPDDAASRPSRQKEDKMGEIQNKGTGAESSTKQSQVGSE